MHLHQKLKFVSPKSLSCRTGLLDYHMLRDINIMQFGIGFAVPICNQDLCQQKQLVTPATGKLLL